MKRGLWYAAGAYVLWGVLPLYWKMLPQVPALEILAHRMLWSLVFVLLLTALRHEWRALRAALRNRRTLLLSALSALLLSINWWLYIWAVNAGFVVETSLGYFINPLVNVVLGVVVLRERLRPWQTLALTLAVAGVAWLTFSYGALPWIALTLALSFGLYGLLRKTAPLESLQGLTLETLVLSPAALLYLVWLEGQGRGAFAHDGLGTTLLLIGAGVVTAVPLLLFAAGARRITMISLGILQYIAPTLQFLIGVLIYHEPLPRTRLLGFVLIWTALAIYTLDGALRAGRAARAQAAETGVPLLRS